MGKALAQWYKWGRQTGAARLFTSHQQHSGASLVKQQVIVRQQHQIHHSVTVWCCWSHGVTVSEEIGFGSSSWDTCTVSSCLINEISGCICVGSVRSQVLAKWSDVKQCSQSCWPTTKTIGYKWYSGGMVIVRYFKAFYTWSAVGTVHCLLVPNVVWLLSSWRVVGYEESLVLFSTDDIRLIVTGAIPTLGHVWNITSTINNGVKKYLLLW